MRASEPPALSKFKRLDEYVFVGECRPADAEIISAFIVVSFVGAALVFLERRNLSTPRIAAAVMDVVSRAELLLASTDGYFGMSIETLARGYAKFRKRDELLIRRAITKAALASISRMTRKLFPRTAMGVSYADRPDFY